MEKKCKVVTLVTDKAENALIVNTEGNKSMWGYKKDHLFTMEYLKNVPAKPYHYTSHQMMKLKKVIGFIILKLKKLFNVLVKEV